MSYDEFYNQDPKLVRFYVRAYEITREREEWARWRMGAYIYTAIADLIPAINPFSKSQPQDYLNKPFAITQEEQDKRDEEDYAKKVEIFKQAMIAQAKLNDKNKNK